MFMKQILSMFIKQINIFLYIHQLYTSNIYSLVFSTVPEFLSPPVFFNGKRNFLVLFRWTSGGWEMEQIDGEEVDGDEDGREGKP